MATMTRADPTDAVHREFGLPRRDAAELVDTDIETIAERLEAGEDVKISSFGRFTVRDKSLRVGRNPKTGELAPILPRRVVAFRASAILKQRINGTIGGGGDDAYAVRNRDYKLDTTYASSYIGSIGGSDDQLLRVPTPVSRR